MKKVLKISSIILVSLLLIAALSGMFFFLYFKKDVKFDMDKLNNSQTKIDIFDGTNQLINDCNTFNNKFVKLNTLPEHVVSAFVSLEDKSFYKHNGIDYKRLAKAMLVNLKERKFKQGASTISQQLIKNTHLTSERTISRKIKEFWLTKDLEKQLSKDQILEYYLNIVYFGNNSYGIENAANYYFSKNAKNLNLDESCVLAGLLSAPNFYSPTKSIEKCKSRRNVVLKALLKDNLISADEYSTLKVKDIDIKINKEINNKLNSYSQGAIDEACEILKLSEKQIALSGFKIYTYQNKDSQNNLKNIFKDYSEDIKMHDCVMTNIDSASGGISAYLGKSKLKLSAIKRQPGSTIKPLLVYAPAIEKGIISPASLVLDDKITIGGYSPKNNSKDFEGYMSIRNALSKSKNIPAIKVLSYVGIEEAKQFAQKMNLKFHESDNNYSIALGGLTEGFNLIDLTNAYSTFSNAGKLKDAKFVKYITNDKGKIVYKNDEKSKTIMREDTSYLITDMLKTCAKHGTAKKLNTIPFDVAAKTGTVGNFDGNTDAYNISYTTENSLGVWVGDVANNRSNILGGALPTMLAESFYKSIKKHPGNFVQPSSVCEVEIDLLDYKENNKLTRANKFTPERYKMKEIFSKFNIPTYLSENYVNLSPIELQIKNVDNKKALTFFAYDYLAYEIYLIENGETKKVHEIESAKGMQEFEIETRPSGNKTPLRTYYVVSKIKNFANDLEVISKKSNEISVIL
ncbi:MAG: transglycosylase domain-containing protein [Clostridia bacterium]